MGSKLHIWPIWESSHPDSVIIMVSGRTRFHQNCTGAHILRDSVITDGP